LQKQQKIDRLEENQARKGGAKPGHPGHGRKPLQPQQSERTIPVHLAAACPDCGTRLESRGVKRRTVLDGQPLKSEKQLLLLDIKRICPATSKICKRTTPTTRKSTGSSKPLCRNWPPP